MNTHIMVQAMPTEQPWTIARLLEWTREHFARKGMEKPRLDAEVLLAHVLGVERIALYTDFDSVVEDDVLARFRECVKKRASHCPVAYITGRKEFFSLTFGVSPDVLIPRPETEFLVEKALALAREHESPTIVDIGTGSGNIAVSLAVKLPDARVIATDLSDAALTIARKNARLNAVEGGILFLKGDMLEPVVAEGVTGEVDLLLSNPPYVAEDEWPGLMSDVRDFEPRAALVSEGDPLRYYRILAGAAQDMLAAGGYLMVEVGAERARGVKKLFQDAGLRGIDCVKDYEGINRVIMGSVN